MYKHLLRSTFTNVVATKAHNYNTNNVYLRIFSTRQSKNKKPTNMEPTYDYNRQWLKTKNPLCEKMQNSFKLLSYNILAQDLLIEHLHLYITISQKWLQWKQRLQSLQREMLKLDPDILCLQEMQYDHLQQLVQCLSNSNGKRLEYIYKKKTGHRTDGCAIIYDSSKFQLLDQYALEMYTENVTLLLRENVALFAKFRLKQSDENKEVIVATTHLLYNPRRGDIRQAQVAKLLSALRDFAENDKSEQVTPIILTGDFNSLANSHPMALLTQQGVEEPKTLKFDILDMGGQTASTHQDDWITVDYILRSNCPESKQKMEVQSVYTLPSINSCYTTGRIPNHFLGSDHYALGAIFELL